MRIKVKIPGSCGELIQGTVNGSPFLVTCPIDSYTEVIVSDQTTSLNGLGVKSLLALQKTLIFLGVDTYPYGMSLRSNLLQGKGMASSSADIAAVCFATAASLKKKLSSTEVGSIAASIEPTDGVFYNGIVCMNHMTGECIKLLGELPQMHIAIFDTGGLVDTLCFHQRDDLHHLNKENEPLLKKAIRLLREPYCAESIGEAASISSLANQKILEKTLLTEIIFTAKSFGAVGVNVAHSGTIIGLLFSPETSIDDIKKTVLIITKKFNHLTYLKTTHLISGGCFIEKW
jgi:L-threonine kinase